MANLFYFVLWKGWLVPVVGTEFESRLQSFFHSGLVLRCIGHLDRIRFGKVDKEKLSLSPTRFEPLKGCKKVIFFNIWQEGGGGQWSQMNIWGIAFSSFTRNFSLQYNIFKMILQNKKSVLFHSCITGGILYTAHGAQIFLMLILV